MEVPPTTRLIPGLPDDISVQIIARIPRSHHRSLCHVSRSWRSFLLSRLLWTLRSSLSLSTEPSLCLKLVTGTGTPWLILERGRCHPTYLPSPPLATVGSACTTAGPFVFVLGGCEYLSGDTLNVVQIFDLRIGGHWFLGPCMSTARDFSGASFLNGRVYAIGGCSPGSEPWAESLDPFDQNPQWVPIDVPMHMREKWMRGYVVVSGNVLAMRDQIVVAYDPCQSTGGCSPWDLVPKPLTVGYSGMHVVVSGILYSYDYEGKIQGYDPVMDKWRTVMGVDKHLPKYCCGSRLANLDGVLCVIWKHMVIGGKPKEMVVSWAGILVTDFCEGGLQGSIVWCETVPLGLPNKSSIEHCVVAGF